jgi:hypothetical protein
VVYEHAALVEAFKTRAKAQQSTPLAMQQLADQHAETAGQVASLKAELAAERAAGAMLRKLAAEVSLELEHVREQLAASGNAISLSRNDNSATSA